MATNKGLGKVGNAGELVNSLLQAYQGVEEDRIPPSYAKEMSALARNAIEIMKTQIVYAHNRGEVPDIPFLGKNLTKAEKLLGK